MGPLFFHAWSPTHAKFISPRARTRSAKHVGANKAITAYRPEIKDIGKKTSTAKTFHSKPRSSRPESHTTETQRDLSVGDVVLVRDESQHRNDWPLG